MKTLLMKVIVALLIVAAAFTMFVGYVTNQYQFYMFAFLIASLVAASLKVSNSPVFAVSAFPCALNNVDSATTECSTRNGMLRGYWAKFSDIDWTAMAAAPLKFDTVTQKIKGFTMIGGAIWKKVGHDKKQGNYEAVYTETDGFYKNSIKLFFMGKDSANRIAFQSATSCCNIVYIAVGNDGSMRLFGVDYDGTLSRILTTLKIVRHGDYGGELGQANKGRDEIDLEGESLYAPLYLDMLESAIPVV